ncbi:MAG TPA: hypothetical protein VKI41_03955 [Vicinamibacteria bacterium]|nr:hypothetical protein [Vicinamibacteria bacterium]
MTGRGSPSRHLPAACASTLAFCAAALVAARFLAHQIDRFVLASDRVRYWAPVLDPARLLSGLPR